MTGKQLEIGFDLMPEAKKVGIIDQPEKFARTVQQKAALALVARYFVDRILKGDKPADLGAMRKLLFIVMVIGMVIIGFRPVTMTIAEEKQAISRPGSTAFLTPNRSASPPSLTHKVMSACGGWFEGDCPSTCQRKVSADSICIPCASCVTDQNGNKCVGPC
jgi:hypothetical protein